MITEKESVEQPQEKTINAGKVKCSKCNRELKSFCECVGDHIYMLCEDCYQDLAFPYFKR